MKAILPTVIALSLAGCEAARTLAPQTTAGFEAGGLLGALDGASGAILARCRTLDGVEVRVAVDSAALATDQTDTVERIRESRQRACAVAGAVALLGDQPPEATQPTVHGSARAPSE